jgi:hypothetical protein
MRSAHIRIDSRSAACLSSEVFDYSRQPSSSHMVSVESGENFAPCFPSAIIRRDSAIDAGAHEGWEKYEVTQMRCHSWVVCGVVDGSDVDLAFDLRSLARSRGEAESAKTTSGSLKRWRIALPNDCNSNKLIKKSWRPELTLDTTAIC